MKNNGRGGMRGTVQPIRFLAAAGPDRPVVFAYSASGYDSLCGSTVTRLYFPSIQRGMSFL